MARKGKKTSDKLAMQNAAKTLLANIRFASIDDPIKTITVTSSRPNEGKTTVAHALAVAAATSGSRTMVVECDMRHRSMANALGVHGAAGMYGVLSGRVALADAVMQTPDKNLMFLDVEPGIPNPPDVLSSKRFKKLVSRLAAEYDLVIFDTPPVGGFVDAAVLASLTDGTVFVVRENFTRREVAADAVEQLRKAGANILGSVLNCCERSSSGYYDYYYHEGEATRPAELPDQMPAHGAGRPVRLSDAALFEPAEPGEASEDDADVTGAFDVPEEPKKASATTTDPSETGAFILAAQQSRGRRAGVHSHMQVPAGVPQVASATPQHGAGASQGVAPDLPVISAPGEEPAGADAPKPEGMGRSSAHREPEGVYVPPKNPYTR